MFDIKDRPGVISSKVMRVYFERGINETEVLKAQLPLDSITRDGLTEYANAETQATWIGFALGMRCAERVAAASQAAAEVSEGIQIGRNAFSMGLPRESLPDEAHRIGWDEAQHAAGVPGAGKTVDGGM
jgi:hypothetical protein